MRYFMILWLPLLVQVFAYIPVWFMSMRSGSAPGGKAGTGSSCKLMLRAVAGASTCRPAASATLSTARCRAFTIAASGVAASEAAKPRVPMGSDGGPWAMDPETAYTTYFVPQGISADLFATLDGDGRPGSPASCTVTS